MAANQLKSSRASSKWLALQATTALRDAGLVAYSRDESGQLIGDSIDRSDVWVVGFDNLLLTVGQEAVSDPHRLELIQAALRDTESLYHCEPASVSQSGNGFQVQLPGATRAGFRKGETVHCRQYNGIVCIHPEDEHRLPDDLLEIRASQLDGA